MNVIISTSTSGKLKVNIDGVSTYLAPTLVSIIPHPDNYSIQLALSAPQAHVPHLTIDWRNITSPVVTDREDAMSKISLLLGSGSFIEQVVTAAGSGASYTTTNNLTGSYMIFVNGAYLNPLLYTVVGNVITFTPAIDDGKTITIIKF